MKKSNKVNVNGLVFRLRKETKTAELTHCTTDVERVVIPEQVNGYKVTIIARGAFKDCAKLTSVVIPNTVNDIADNAFVSCKELSDVVVTESTGTHCYSFFLCPKLNFAYNY